MSDRLTDMQSKINDVRQRLHSLNSTLAFPPATAAPAGQPPLLATSVAPRREWASFAPTTLSNGPSPVLSKPGVMPPEVLQAVLGQNAAAAATPPPTSGVELRRMQEQFQDQLRAQQDAFTTQLRLIQQQSVQQQLQPAALSYSMPAADVQHSEPAPVRPDYAAFDEMQRRLRSQLTGTGTRDPSEQQEARGAAAPPSLITKLVSNFTPTVSAGPSPRASEEPRQQPPIPTETPARRHPRPAPSATPPAARQQRPPPRAPPVTVTTPKRRAVSSAVITTPTEDPNPPAHLVSGGPYRHPVRVTGAEVFAILRLRGIIASDGTTGEHLLPQGLCHTMYVSDDEYEQLAQLRQVLKQQHRTAPRNASERRGRPSSATAAVPGFGKDPMSLRASESAMAQVEGAGASRAGQPRSSSGGHWK